YFCLLWGFVVNSFSVVMFVEVLVFAVLVGFDRRVLVTIPPLLVADRWVALDGARQGLLSDLRQAQASERYQAES
ncbi:SDR family oxidoreductase, partial [Pseudomonas syringae pv. tagetis]